MLLYIYIMYNKDMHKYLNKHNMFTVNRLEKSRVSGYNDIKSVKER